ncbi:hypothetical protein A0H81_09962 [Grifola frondosa]|uniref:Uncharacterized protein n=1 Tax=Grifola frondosa TaxID=5627 RepID=A0A1C7M239_GRIFR|nr:hypothetical protein A0H81_09962 [Grifola frondosa]
MSLTYMESVVYVDDGKVPYTARHKRFASVADWNARVKSSLRRTWERAWGATQVAASVSLAVKNVTGNAYETKFPKSPKRYSQVILAIELSSTYHQSHLLSPIGWKSPLSPTSPLIGALSASMRWKRAARQSAIRKVKDIQSNQVNRLSALKSINIRLARLTASHRPPGSSADSDDVFKTIVKNIQLDAGLSDPATSPSTNSG